MEGEINSFLGHHQTHKIEEEVNMFCVCQCPYCPKKFLSTVYLCSHVVRRHQGLPLPNTTIIATQGQLVVPQGSKDSTIIGDKGQGNSSSIPVTGLQGPELILNPMTMTQVQAVSNSTVALIGQVEERFQKQKTDLQNIQENLQTKVEVAVKTVLSQLESQEQYWSSRMRVVEERHQAELNRLRDELSSQVSLALPAPTKTRTQITSAACQTSPPRSGGGSRSPPPHRNPSSSSTLPKSRSSNGHGNLSPGLVVTVNSNGNDGSSSGQDPDLPGHHHHQEPERTLRRGSSSKVLEVKSKGSLNNNNMNENPQVKSDLDKRTVLGLLESQERFWSSKMRVVEERYQEEMKKLREDFHSLLATKNHRMTQGPGDSISSPILGLRKNREDSPPRRRSKKRDGSLTPTRSRSCSPIGGAPPPSQSTPKKTRSLHVHTTPRDSKNLLDHGQGQGQPKLKPKVKPRSSIPSSQKEPQHRAPEPKTQDHEIPDQSSNYIQVKSSHQPHQLPPPSLVTHHEYEEPEDVENLDHVSDYSSSDDEEEDVTVTSDSDPSLSEDEKRSRMRRKREKELEDQKQKDGPEPPAVTQPQPQQPPLDPISKMDVIRKQVIEDINKQMKELGVNPDGTELRKKDAKTIFSKVRKRRKELEKTLPNYAEERKRTRQKTRVEVATQLQEEKQATSRFFSPKKQGAPHPGVPSSPILKMIHGLTGQGQGHGGGWGKRLSFSFKKSKNGKFSPTHKAKKAQPPHKLKTFFSRAKWNKRAKGGGQGQGQDGPGGEPNPNNEESPEEDEDESSSSEEPNMPMLTRSKPIIVENKNSSNKGQRSSSTTSDSKSKGSPPSGDRGAQEVKRKDPPWVIASKNHPSPGPVAMGSKSPRTNRFHMAEDDPFRVKVQGQVETKVKAEKVIARKEFDVSEILRQRQRVRDIIMSHPLSDSQQDSSTAGSISSLSSSGGSGSESERGVNEEEESTSMGDQQQQQPVIDLSSPVPEGQYVRLKEVKSGSQSRRVRSPMNNSWDSDTE